LPCCLRHSFFWIARCKTVAFEFLASAVLKNDELRKIKMAGFEVKILSEDKEISEMQYHRIALESINIETTKKI